VKRIGFCFLIYDKIDNEDLWHLFFDGVPEALYRVFVHYKTDRPLQYFEASKLERCIPTKYGDVSIVHAHNLLFEAALKAGCDKIVNLSQSCIPLKSFEHVHAFLSRDDRGHFNVCPTDQCFPRCNSLLEHYERNVIQKSSNWFILNRKLAELVTMYPAHRIDLEFSQIHYPEEHYFITRIYQNGLQSEIDQTPNLAEDATTFTNWEGMSYQFVSRSWLKNYSKISKAELTHLLKSRCLFGRKFVPGCRGLHRRFYLKSIRSAGGKPASIWSVLLHDLA
jgi:hypothetical protein